MEKNFKNLSNKIRFQFLKLLSNGFKYHIGGTASCIDLLVVLFFGNFINLEKKSRSNFILSKGHSLGALHSILINKNLITERKLREMRLKGRIGGQLDIFNLKKYTDWNTGSLGHSIGVITGFAIANPNKKMWTIVGDGEMDEGSVWESIFFISEKKIKNVIVIIDRNKISASAKINKKVIFDKKILNLLNLNIFKINGHNFKEIYNSFKKAKKSNKSSIIIADTIKGKGFGIAENNLKFSHLPLNPKIIKKLISRYE